jgi:hypothetical protein
LAFRFEFQYRKRQPVAVCPRGKDFQGGFTRGTKEGARFGYLTQLPYRHSAKSRGLANFISCISHAMTLKYLTAGLYLKNLYLKNL